MKISETKITNSNFMVPGLPIKHYAGGGVDSVKMYANSTKNDEEIPEEMQWNFP